MNRPIMSGIMTSLGSYTRQTLQTAFDGVTNPSEERTTTFNTSLGAFYTNTSFPNATAYTVKEADLRTLMYYDDYNNWQTDANYNFQSSLAFHAQGFTKGLITGMFVRNLETNAWYKNVNFFDLKSRPIQSFSQNNVGGIDRSEYQYHFNGEILKMRMVHKKTGAKDLMELYEYSYNHMGVKTSFTHNGLVVAKYEMDGINRLQNKKFRPAGTATGSSQTGNWTDLTTWQSGVLPLANDNVTINTGQIVTIPNGQSGSAGILNDRGTLKNFGTLNMGKFSTSDLYVESLKYHIRGGLRGKNLDASDNLTNSLFSFKIEYEGNNGFFDGNIKNQYWKSSIDGIQRAYQYNYDIASRLLSGTYGSTKAGEDYSLNGVTYDFNSNITTLSRNGYKSNNTFGLIDNLGYDYQTNSNKIQSVSDNSGETASFNDATGSTDYTYYLDGSLKSDANKGISLIEYNYLKLPKKVVQNGITMLIQYDALGNKLKETISTQVTDYLDNKIYKNNALYQIGHDEGRIINGEYEYNIKDHLGNLRVSFRDSLGIAKITQANSYGCWGEDLTTLSYLKQSWKADNFKFTGKEELQGTGYVDFGARWYDNIVPRFTTIDQLSELSRRFSPTVYANGNPLRFIDPDGMQAQTIYGFDGKAHTVGDDQQTNVYQAPSEDNKKEDSNPPTELQFDQQGNYVGAIDDGKKEYSGSIVDKKGNVKSRFEFNDQSDGANIISGGIAKLDLRFSAMINIFMSKAGVMSNKSFLTRYFYAFFNSLAGESIDFVPYLARYSKTDKVLYLAGNRAYNNYDAGNFLWGRAINTVGIGYTGAQIGSEVNGFLFGKRQNGQGSGITWGGDSKEDQKAILHGFYWYLYKQKK